MLRASLSYGRGIADSLKPLKVIGEVKADITENSIRFLGLDDSNCIFMDLLIDKSSFEEYKLNPEPLSICLPVNEFITALNRVDSANLEIVKESIKISNNKKKVIMPLLDKIKEIPENLNLEFENALTIYTSDLKKALRDIAVVFSQQASYSYGGYNDNESIKLEINNKNAILSYRESNGKEMTIIVAGNKKGLGQFEKDKEAVVLLISRELLEKAVKNISSSEITLFAGKKSPLKLKTKELEVLIAPRVSYSDEPTSSGENEESNEIDDEDEPSDEEEDE